jgi:hypothetical protein
MKKNAFVLVAMLALAGCAAVGPVFSPVTHVAAGNGVIYVYRPEAGTLSLMTAVFELNGRPFASIESNGFSALPVPAGKYTLVHRWKAGSFGNAKLEDRPMTINVSVAPGKSTYVRLLSQANTTSATSGMGGTRFSTQLRWYMQEVSEAVALPEIQQTKGQVANPPP